jgi:hypothetical protein
LESPLLNLLSSDVWDRFQPEIERLKGWKYYDDFIDAVRNLNREVLFKSPVHGEGHIERVMLHGAFEAMDNGLDREDTGLLLTMCAYHDTGRLSDWMDDAHGKRAAEKLADITGAFGENLKMMMAGVEAHSRRDSDLTEIVAGYKPKDYGRCRKLAEMLKDSDGLDRVRIKDLDTKFLRFPSAVRHADFSAYLFEIYNEELERMGRETAAGDYFNADLVKNTKDKIYRYMEKSGYNGSQTILAVLCGLFGMRCTNSMLSASAAMGKYGKGDMPCSLYVGAVMFIGVYCMSRKMTKEEMTDMAGKFTELYLGQYKSFLCRDLMPEGEFTPDRCGGRALDMTLFTYEYITSYERNR